LGKRRFLIRRGISVPSETFLDLFFVFLARRPMFFTRSTYVLFFPVRVFGFFCAHVTPSPLVFPCPTCSRRFVRGSPAPCNQPQVSVHDRTAPGHSFCPPPSIPHPPPAFSSCVHYDYMVCPLSLSLSSPPLTVPLPPHLRRGALFPVGLTPLVGKTLFLSPQSPFFFFICFSGMLCYLTFSVFPYLLGRSRSYSFFLPRPPPPATPLENCASGKLPSCP